MPRFEEPHSRWTKGCREGSRIVLNARSQATPRPRRVQHLRARGRVDEKDTVLLTPCECKLPLTVWFQAIYLMTQDKKGVSAMKLHRHLGISYNAAWRMRHKLVQVMMEQDCEHPTAGRVELDDAYLGHSATGHSTLLACVDAETRNPTARSSRRPDRRKGDRGLDDRAVHEVALCAVAVRLGRWDLRPARSSGPSGVSSARRDACARALRAAFESAARRCQRSRTASRTTRPSARGARVPGRAPPRETP